MEVEEFTAEQQDEQQAEEQEVMHPYQRTRFYQNELMLFEEAYAQLVNKCYEHERNVFGEQQQQLYEHAIVLKEEGEQHQRQQEVDVP
jgi:hypothetical protein